MEEATRQTDCIKCFCGDLLPLASSTSILPGSFEVGVFDDASPIGDKMPAMVFGHSPELAMARAHIFAASPDLLAACEAALRTCENNKYVRSGFDELIPTLRAAICKAKGGAA